MADQSLRNLTLGAIDEFDCGHDAFDVMDYLRNRAVDDDLVGRCRTYLIVDLDRMLARNPEVEILSFFTITQHRLDISDLAKDDSMAEVAEYLLGDTSVGTGGQRTVSGYLIAHFAKDKRFFGSAKGFLQFAQTIIERASELVGGVYIVLDCGAERLRDYYHGFGFDCIGEHEDAAGGRVFQMLKLIGQGVDKGFLSDRE